MKSVVSGSPRADYINEQYQRVVDKARDFTEKACALGGICLKPYVVQQTGQVAVSIVQAADFYPAAWNSDGDVTAAVFVDTTYINDKKYTRLEYHKLLALSILEVNPLRPVLHNMKPSGGGGAVLGK